MLALGDICGRTVIAELTLEDDEGHLADGTDVRAAIGVLQRIGVTTVILRARSMEELSEALERTAPLCAAVARRVRSVRMDRRKPAAL